VILKLPKPGLGCGNSMKLMFEIGHGGGGMVMVVLFWLNKTSNLTFVSCKNEFSSIQ
jgi:hypothetical protein